MKIAEGLFLRDELTKRIESLSNRIESNIRVADGESPLENPDELIETLLQVEDELQDLVIKINHKNLTTESAEGNLLADLIAERDRVMDKKRLLDAIMYRVNNKSYSDDSSENKIVIDVKKLQKQIDKLAKQYREINVELQQANWTIDL